MGCGAQKEEATPNLAQTKLNTIELTVGTTAVVAEVADSDQERQMGLMYRESLGQNEGMLFVYPDSGERYFWMKNTTIALSIAYINEEGEIVRIKDLTPLSEQRVSSEYPVKYALEMSQGWFKRNGVRMGHPVTGLPLGEGS